MQKEKINTCPTCGADNDIYSSRCVNCQRILSNAVHLPKSLSPIPSFKVIDDVSDDTQKKSLLKLFVRMSVILIVFFFLIFPWFWLVRNGHGIGNAGSASSSLGINKTLNGETIGVNDGSFVPFDIGRPTQTLKQQAAQKLKAGDAGGAIALWQEALHLQGNDAEALIYIEDQLVLASGKPYVTLVAGTAFTLPLPDVSYESELQGMYVEQHAFNAENHPYQLRILIANSGSDASTTAAVAQQITQIAKHDASVVGVIGWLNSASTESALQILAGAKIPIISPQASSDYLTNISSYFFRVVPSNKIQVQAAAQFMKNTLHATNPVVFVDPRDAYSQNLAQDFEAQFASEGHLHEEIFTTNNTQDFASLIQDALKYHPDAFYFTSASSVDVGLFQDALPTSGAIANIPVMAGSGSYIAHKNSWGRWYFIADAYHGAGDTPISQKFQQEYSADFNAHNQKPGGYYGYTLADNHAIVAYDATAVTLQAILNSGKTKPTPQDLAHELAKITGANAFQGVSGQIAFGSDGNPINKTILILFVSRDGHIQLQSLHGVS